MFPLRAESAQRRRDQGIRYGSPSTVRSLLCPLLLFLLVSCASPGAVGNGETGHGEQARENRLDEESLRLFLFQAKRYWNALSASIEKNREVGRLSEFQADDFAVQDREFSKYYTNALTLYLRADASDDLARSLHTVRAIVELSRACFPEVDGDLSAVLEKRGNTISVVKIADDPRRLFLYQALTRWNELRSYALSRQVRSERAPEDNDYFERVDADFSRYFYAAVMVYLESGASDDYRRQARRLEDLLDQASRFHRTH
ncbi:MAG: hypothetical protein M1497_15270 [Nitrospirae bacterium]|nr:hypothetical protein [Nitrospirota bacterium]